MPIARSRFQSFSMNAAFNSSLYVLNSVTYECFQITFMLYLIVYHSYSSDQICTVTINVSVESACIGYMYNNNDILLTMCGETLPYYTQ